MFLNNKYLRNLTQAAPNDKFNSLVFIRSISNNLREFGNAPKTISLECFAPSPLNLTNYAPSMLIVSQHTLSKFSKTFSKSYFITLI